MKKNWFYFLLVIEFVIDLCLVYLSFILVYQIRFYASWFVELFPVTKGIPAGIIYRQPLNFVVIFSGLVFWYIGFYRRKSLPALDEFLLVIKGTSLTTLFIMALTFLYREFEYSRLVIICTWIVGIIIIYLWHEIFKLSSGYLFRRMFGPVRILVLGQGKTAETMLSLLKKQTQIKVHYLPDIDPKRIIETIKKKEIEEVIYAPVRLNHTEVQSIDDLCGIAKVDFKFVPDLMELRMGELIVDTSWGLPLLHLKSLSLTGTNFILKRVMDLVISLLIVTFFAPIIIFISFLILIDSMGPVMYLHLRKGHRGKNFHFYKFRTMRINADVLLAQLRSSSERGGPVFKMRRDPRVTRVGSFLRRFSIDELPQLINVLRGEMSLVGPRPQVLWETEAYDNFARKRLNVLPGITGLWQVSGRADLPYEEMIRLDIYYLENWSLGLDLKILLKTISAVLIAKGAY